MLHETLLPKKSFILDSSFLAPISAWVTFGLVHGGEEHDSESYSERVKEKKEESLGGWESGADVHSEL